MKRLHVFVLACLCLLSAAAYGQYAGEGRNKAIYVEGLGSGLLISANYDFRFKPTQDGLGMRIGIGGASVDGTSMSGGVTRSASIGLVTLPVLVNYLAGTGRVAFEAGAGLTPIYVSVTEGATLTNDFAKNSGFGVFGSLNLGVRAQPIRNGVVFRLNWTPIITSDGFQSSWGGISLGYGFK